MGKFKRTNRAGRGIALLFANVGWGIAAVGVLLAIAGVLLGATPGSGGIGGPVTLLMRVVAAVPGAGLALFGLFAVLMAAQTRATLDTADMTRALLGLAQSTGSAASLVGRRDVDLVKDTAVSLPVVPAAEEAPAKRPAPRAPLPVTSPAIVKADHRPEPTMKAASKPTPKPHPIFSAKPPR